jgi:hypothetical protein
LNRYDPTPTSATEKSPASFQCKRRDAKPALAGRRAGFTKKPVQINWWLFRNEETISNKISLNACAIMGAVYYF